MRYTLPALLPVWFCGALLFTGCTTTQNPMLLQQQHTIDSLRTVNRTMNDRIVALSDTLQFFDDIESGYYYREKGALEDRVEKLDYQLTVCREGGRPVATLLADDLFEPASATLSENGIEQLAALAATLKDEYGDARIRVEGHTDSVPPGENLRKTYPTNWELSAARATTVVRHLAEVHEVPAAQLEAIAYGPSQPVGRNDSAEGRRQNRRVRVTVLL